MQCIQTLGSYNWSVAHPFIQPNALPFWGFRAGFLAFWGGKRTSLCGISAKALPAWYKYLIYNQCNVHKHLEVIIEVSLIQFYIQTFFRFGVSELDFWRSGVVNGLVHGVPAVVKSIPARRSRLVFELWQRTKQTVCHHIDPNQCAWNDFYWYRVYSDVPDNDWCFLRCQKYSRSVKEGGLREKERKIGFNFLLWYRNGKLSSFNTFLQSLK